MEEQVQTQLREIILQLEKRYPYFKKMDIYSTVNKTYKKVHTKYTSDNELEFQTVQELADKDLFENSLPFKLPPKTGIRPA
ncbi:MAG TPA: hypothetical protein VG847_16255 [Chitinophagaceae bacterium]|nr:hypothetical protein [Chitinophagaceae bacterium]